MHGTPQEVEPGDLITADFMNGILARIEELEDKVTALEGTTSDGSVLITQLIPAGTAVDPIRVGQQLQILGQNFGFSVGGHRVFFDSIQMTAYGAGSSDVLLIVTVPATLNILPGGRSVTLTVTNGVTTEFRTITVLPVEQTLTGDIDVLWRTDAIPNPDPDTITLPTGPPEIVIFAYRLRSRVNLQTSVTIATPTISVPEWQSGLRVLDASRNTMGAEGILLNPGEEADFFIEATISTPASPPTDFDLTVVASAGGITGSSTRNFPVGTVIEPADPNITLAVTASVPSGAGDTFDAATNTINVTPDTLFFMIINGEFLVAATYNVTLLPSAGTTDWNPTLQSPSSYTETAAANETIQFSVQPQASASSTGQVTLQVQREGEAQSQSLIFNLALRT